MISLLLGLLLFFEHAVGTIVYEGGTIISFNNSTQKFQILRDASIVIEGDKITQMSEDRASIKVPPNAVHINATDKIIGAGYIDTHHHLWQTAFKTIASNTTLAQYFQRYSEFSPAIEYFTPEDIYLGQMVGILELLYEGTTTVLDHAHASWSDSDVDASVNATFESGVRAFYAFAVHELPNGYTWDDQISKLRSLGKDRRFRDQDGIVKLGLAYDNFYIASAKNTSTLWNITKESDLQVVTCHDVSGPWNVRNSPELLHSLGWLNDSVPVIFSHATFLDYEDARALRQNNQYISTTPESEFHYGHINPNSHNIQDQAALGVDTHFTFCSSMVQQARLWLQSLRWPASLQTIEHWVIPVNNPMSVEQAYHLITRAGGLALRRPDLGVVQVGAKADLVVYRTDAPNMVGWSDPIAALILHSQTSDLEDVLVSGKFVKRGGKLLYRDYSAVRQKFTASAKRIQKIWAERNWSPLRGDFNSGKGGPYGRALVIDTQRGSGTGY